MHNKYYLNIVVHLSYNENKKQYKFNNFFDRYNIFVFCKHL